MVCTRSSTVERTEIRPWNEVLDPEAVAAVLSQLVEDVPDRGGGLGLDAAAGRHADRLGLAALGEASGM